MSVEIALVQIGLDSKTYVVLARQDPLASKDYHKEWGDKSIECVLRIEGMSNLEQLVVRTLVCGGNHTGVITRYRLLLHAVFAPCHSPRVATFSQFRLPALHFMLLLKNKPEIRKP